MTHDSLASVPWQITGNHWLSIPCIHPADAAIHALGVLHRGARSAVEFAGHERFLEGTHPALARPTLEIAGRPVALAVEGIVWERALHWLPTFTATPGDLVVRGTIFAPFGRDADIAGAVYALTVENRGTDEADVVLALEGTLGHRQLRVLTPRPASDSHQVSKVGDVVVLEGSEPPGHVAIAIAADGDAEVSVRAGDPASYRAPSYAVRRRLKIPAGGRVETAFYIAAGPERDGACATVSVLRRRGWRALLTGTRDAIRSLEQTTGMELLDGLINRHLLFAYFYGVARALDDAHYYLVRSRAPWCARGVTIRDWEALAWTVPAVQLADAPLARERILRACEVHGYAPGRGVHYFDGTLFEPGFTLEGAAAYAIATDRYIRDTGDDQIVEEPVLADTLYLSSDDLAARRDKTHPLYHTEVTLSGVPVTHPFTLHGNAVVAHALECLRRTLDEEEAAELPDPSAVRAAIRRHFTTGDGSKTVFVAAADLAGGVTRDDDPVASALWIPLFEAVERNDSVYRRTAKQVGSHPRHLAQQLGRLFGPDASAVLEWLRRAPLDHGLAAEFVDEEGRAVSNGGDAALSGLLAYAVWFTVHAHGVRP
ncbi:MAG: hypothetical protein ACHQQR_03385 [Gemmatimonadales bacterium]